MRCIVAYTSWIVAEFRELGRCRPQSARGPRDCITIWIEFTGDCGQLQASGTHEKSHAGFQAFFSQSRTCIYDRVADIFKIIILIDNIFLKAIIIT